MSSSWAAIGKHVRSLLRWLGRHELSLVLPLLVAASAGWCFAQLASEVSEGELGDLDRWLLLGLRSGADHSDPIGPHWLEVFALDITALGGWPILTLVTLAGVSYLLLLRRGLQAAFLAGAVAGAGLLSLLMKSYFGRPRPDLVPHLAQVSSASFPSGHSLLSTATYLTVGALLARAQPSSLLKAYTQLWALLIATLVGLSRVYLGVHWPTDVLAGWAAGAGWAALCWAGAAALGVSRARALPADAPSETPATAGDHS